MYVADDVVVSLFVAIVYVYVYELLFRYMFSCLLLYVIVHADMLHMHIFKELEQLP